MDSALWELAKAAVQKTYPMLSRESEDYWGHVQRTASGLVESEVRKAKEREAAPIQWEPPGDSHPNTWRARGGVGGGYIYRKRGPGGETGRDEKDETSSEGQVVTAGSKDVADSKKQKMRLRQELKEAARKHDGTEHQEKAAKDSEKKGEGKRKMRFKGRQQVLDNENLQANARQVRSTPSSRKMNARDDAGRSS